MFQNLLGLLSGKKYLEEVLEEFSDMLKTAERMYATVVEDYFSPNPDEEFEQSIYDMDQEINDHERHIRRRIVEHLTIYPKKGMNVSLILMSVIKDAERIGDLIKNLLETGKMLDRPLDKDEFTAYFNDLPHRLAGYFSTTLKTFVEFNEKEAYDLIRNEREFCKECDAIIRKLADSDLKANHAVCYTITARYFKRIAAHLVNIATAVVVPLSDLDYFDERRMPES